jgi:hypothetical protein
MAYLLARLASFSFFGHSRNRMETDFSMTTGRWADLLLTSLAAIVIAFVITMAIGAASAQEHRHPKEDEELHHKFYATWMMPDNPKKSCCNKADCYPTEARFQDGQWFAQRREDGKFLRIPALKVEQTRDSPDGRNHLCAPPPYTGYHPPDAVFCFKPGAGL